MQNSFYLLISKLNQSHEDHGDAEGLTSKEISTAKKVSKSFKKNQTKLKKIFCSPHTHSIQTADVFHDEMPVSLSALKDMDDRNESETLEQYAKRMEGLWQEILAQPSPFLVICPELNATILIKHLGLHQLPLKTQCLYQITNANLKGNAWKLEPL